MARSRELWLGAGGSLIAVGAALASVAVVLFGHQVWTSTPMAGAYGAGVLSATCLLAAVRDWPVPFAADHSVGIQGTLKWGIPLTIGWVDRAELSDVTSALTDTSAEAVALTTGLVGAGGFGKTMLAARACQQETVRRRFPGGVCWLTVGEHLRGPSLAQRISEAVWNLNGAGPAFTSLEEAGRALALALACRRRTLLVADDVWTAEQLAPFVTAGQAGRLLVTTRYPEVLAGIGARKITVDALSVGVARAVLTQGLPSLNSTSETELLGLVGRWPLLLSLVNARLAQLHRRGTVNRAAHDVASRLRSVGIAASLDIGDKASRDQAAAAVTGYSLELLKEADRDKFFQLAIFAEDAPVPLSLVAALWQATNAAASVLCGRLASLSLLSLTWPEGQQAVIIHDVIREYIRSAIGPQRIAELNRAFLAAFRPGGRASLLPDAANPVISWWELAPTDGYLRSHLIWHLLESKQQNEAEELACDLRWAGTRLEESGPAAVAADLALVGTPRAARMAAATVRTAHLLAPTGPGEPAGVLTDTFHSRIGTDPDWGPQVRALAHTYPRLRIVARWPPPDLPGSIQRAILYGHQGPVHGLCEMHIAGRHLLASASSDQTVRIWDPATGAEEKILLGHEDWVTSACTVGVAGRQLLASTSFDRTIRIWDPATGAEERVLHGHQDLILKVCAVRAAGRQVLATASFDGTVRIWEPATGAELTALRGHEQWATAVGAVKVAGRQLLVTADKTVRIWDPATGDGLKVLYGHEDSVWGVCAINLGGRELLATASDDKTVRIWDPASGDELKVLQSHGNGVRAVCPLSIAGRQLLATGGEDHTVRIWDPVTGLERIVLHGHESWVHAVCTVNVAGKQLVASASTDHTIRLWDLPADIEHPVVYGDQIENRHENWINAVCAVDVAGRQLVASADLHATVRIWDPDTGSELRSMRGHQSRVGGICAVGATGRQLLATASGDNTVRIWDPQTAIQKTVLHGHRDWVNDVCALDVAGQQLLASASDDKTVRIWDPQTGTELKVLRGHQESVRGVCAVTVKGQHQLATASDDKTVRIWDPQTGTEEQVLRGHLGGVNDVCALDATGRHLLATASWDETVRVWDPDAGSELWVLRGHRHRVGCVCAMYVGGQPLLVSASEDRTVRIWDPLTGYALALIRTAEILDACAQIDSKLLAVGGIAGLYGFEVLIGAVLDSHQGRSG